MAAPPTGPDAAWRGFARGFLVTALCLVAGYLALALVLDPYDSGRSPFGTRGVRPQGPRTVTLLLTGAGGGGALGVQTTTTLWILDAD